MNNVHFIFNRVQAVYPIPDPRCMLDKRMHDLDAYARKVENDMFRKATSQEQYDSLIKEKINQIRKVLGKFEQLIT